MKQFLNFFSEARSTQASVQAHKKGWTGDGHGSWFDKEGNLVAKTVKGILTPISRRIGHVKMMLPVKRLVR